MHSWIDYPDFGLSVFLNQLKSCQHVRRSGQSSEKDIRAAHRQPDIFVEQQLVVYILKQSKT